jgi:hypothetical protein
LLLLAAQLLAKSQESYFAPIRLSHSRPAENI